MTDGPTADRDLDALLEHVRAARGFDFTGYKRHGVARRVSKRLEALGLTTFGEYLDHLEVHPEEFDAFFDAILINVTSFRRDEEPWRVLAERVLPEIAVRDHPVRVWSAACSSGEEPYTLAVLLAEVMGADAFRERAKIYATDVDETSLVTARAGCYAAERLAALGEDLRDRYFEPSANGLLCFRADLRRSVIFGRHDVVQDAPISRLDLLVSRNMLMYFDVETQHRIVERFHFALRDDGFLFLGKAETLAGDADLFTPVDAGARIFRKNPAAAGRASAVTRPVADRERPSIPVTGLREASFDAGPIPQVVVDGAGVVVAVNAAARRQFRLGVRDVGAPLQDLEVSYRPADVRSSIDLAYAEHRVVVLADVEWPGLADTTRYLEVQVVPLFDGEDEPLGASITFSDVTRQRQLLADLEHVNRQLEMAYEELQSTNEELETTNEELQSTIEELETTNEELQSTNEELETMNEELQSTNDELHGANDALRSRSDELEEARAFLEAIVASIHRGVIVVDTDLRVRLWNDRSEDLWGLRADEVRGQPLPSLDFGFPVAAVEPALRAALKGDGAGDSILVEARTRRGYDIRCRVTCEPLAVGTGGVRGAILVVEDVGTG